MQTGIWKVAVPSPLHQTFDYLPAPTPPAVRVCPGMRVRVPFGHSTRVGVVTGTAAESRVEDNRLRRAHELLDEEPLLPDELMQLLQWASAYYHHPASEVILGAMPGLLRRGGAARPRTIRRWRLTDKGCDIDPVKLRNAPRQRTLLAALARSPEGLGAEQLEEHAPWKHAMRALIDKGWVNTDDEPVADETTEPPRTPETIPELNPSQRDAAGAVLDAEEGFCAYLLDGVTGSGKTEVYLQTVAHHVQAGRQALVLVPEIGLTPQLVERFRRRFAGPLAVLHSGLSDRERLDAWLMARSGAAPVVIGTRSAVFAPLARPGIIIVDEEHDASYKQHDGFRYHARDLAVVRARRLGIPVVLGSATPSLESLYNCEQGRYRRLVLAARAGAASQPKTRLVNMRDRGFQDALSERLRQAIEKHLEQRSQVLLFLNRRGYAPTLLCHDCGWVADCHRCDAHMILHRAGGTLRCHHCDTQRPVDASCPQCGSIDLRPLGQGTERMEEALAQHFPDVEIVRIDRDSTRRRGSMESLLGSVQTGERQILVGTQMLTKGHHLPNVTLVGILDADQGLFGADFRSSERMGQLITQVAGRAGRAEKPGEVLIQTHHPEHPLLTDLLRQDYYAFARNLLAERRQAMLPPYGCLALLRAESVRRDAPDAFLSDAYRCAMEHTGENVRLLGPAPAPMERRAGRYRSQLLFQSDRRGHLHRTLSALLPRISGLQHARRVRWSLDVDPVDEF